MPLVLARIDDRLIHGQVTVGWSRKLQPDRIVLCSDEIHADPWQSRVYASCAPPGTAVSVLDRAGAAAALGGGEGAFDPDERTILLTSDPADMLDLHRRGVALPRINVGGMHYAKGKAEMHEFVWLDRNDLAGLRQLLASGCALSAQTVPGTREHPITDAELDDLDGRL